MCSPFLLTESPGGCSHSSCFSTLVFLSPGGRSPFLEIDSSSRRSPSHEEDDTGRPWASLTCYDSLLGFVLSSIIWERSCISSKGSTFTRLWATFSWFHIPPNNRIRPCTHHHGISGFRTGSPGGCSPLSRIYSPGGRSPSLIFCGFTSGFRSGFT